MRDSGSDAQPITRDKGKGPIVPDNVDTPMDDELSSGNSLSLNLSLTKNTRESIRTRFRKRPSSHLAFSDAISGASGKARREAGRRQYWLGQSSGNPSVLPSGTLPLAHPMHPAFGTTPTFYVLPTALIRRSNDMLFSLLWRHILDYEPPCGFVILAFTMFDGSADPYDHMLHYNQAMTLNAGNDRLLCKVFSASLREPALAWFQKLLHYSINLFYELWAALILQYLYSMQ